MSYADTIESEAYQSMKNDPDLRISKLPYIVSWLKTEINRQHEEIKTLKGEDNENT